jgi:preprotein translocase subunit SecA
MTLNAMTGRGAHLVTVNDYLAQRDAGWMGALYDFLGLSVGIVIPYESYVYDPSFTNEGHSDPRFQHLRPATRQEAYQADITYGTNNEFGFDYLRDNMARAADELRQRELAFAIVDEVDSILIDEARTPLIISAPSSESADLYRKFSKAVNQLTPDDYELDEKQRSVTLNDQGVEKMQTKLKIDNLYDASQVQSLYHIEQALRALTLFRRDKEYVVNNGEVIIVDEFTGRLMVGRRYSEGLHQAIEAKEGVTVQQESMTLATISFQNYFRLYKKLSGMTGTAATEAEEFHTIYKLDVVTIPPNKPSQRVDLPDRIYKTEAGKFRAIVEEVKQRQKKGQPVLLGTVSVEKNEELSRLLTKAKVQHEVLNAKNNEREASIVAEAGQKGAVTLATNIAGRGTDIVLGKGVVKLGGLHVIGSERHDSRRIDNQLRGRGGRQGDPGSTQFYVSTEDDLMRIFGGDRMRSVLERIGHSDETPIEHRLLSRSLEAAQKKVESHNFDARKNIVQYDDVMNRHRKATYSRRRQALMGEDIKPLVEKNIEEEIQLIARALRPETKVTVLGEAADLFNLETAERKALEKAAIGTLEADLLKQAQNRYMAREKQFGEEIMRSLERSVYLQILDELWMQHLENMQHLREGIGWRGVGQRDPLVEYRREGQQLFDDMQAQLRTTLIRILYRAQLTQVPQRPSGEEAVDTALTRAAGGTATDKVPKSAKLSSSAATTTERRTTTQHRKPIRKKSSSRKKKPRR